MFALNWRDLGLGTVVAAITAALTVLYDLLSTGGAINWKAVGIAGLTAGISYLLKNFFTPPKTMIMAPKEDVTVSTTSSGKTVVTAQPGEGK